MAPKPEDQLEENDKLENRDSADSDAHSSHNISRQTLIERGRQFLEDENIQNASELRKRSFLTKKGLFEHEIDKLLKNSQRDKAVLENTRLTFSDDKANSDQQTTGEEPHPIITYPEHLLRRARPEPIVSPKTVANALYVASGIATIIFGCTNYFFEPMIARLQESRHDLAHSTLGNLAVLLERLCDTVSQYPSTINSNVRGQDESGREQESLSDSDPTELFHVDVGTQTSPQLSRRPSDLSLTVIPPCYPESLALAHEKDLKSIHARLSSLLRDFDVDGLTELESTVNGIRDSLEVILSNGDHQKMGGIECEDRKYKIYQESEVFKETKTAIRSIKGLLLNPRNFPSAPSSLGVSHRGVAA